MTIRAFLSKPSGAGASKQVTRHSRCVRRLLPVLVVSCAILAVVALGAPPESRRGQITKLVVQIQRADYEGDQSALKHLFEDLAAFTDDKELGPKVRYWRGFAQWRRAINGFNDAIDLKELEQDLRLAVSEFQEAIAQDPAFADAKAAAGSAMGILMFLHRKDPALAPELNDPPHAREFFLKALSYVSEAEAADPENPRVLWVLGQNRWVMPQERGGGQDKAFEVYQKGLKAARERKRLAGDPLMPSWGEPELLMNLAWSNLNRSTPDLAAAEQYARSALALVPYWHYVRDILIPSIAMAKAKPQKSSDRLQ
jgi:tetratricopeptide (TPR) repeat protein